MKFVFVINCVTMCAVSRTVISRIQCVILAGSNEMFSALTPLIRKLTELFRKST